MVPCHLHLRSNLNLSGCFLPLPAPSPSTTTTCLFFSLYCFSSVFFVPFLFFFSLLRQWNTPINYLTSVGKKKLFSERNKVTYAGFFFRGRGRILKFSFFDLRYHKWCKPFFWWEELRMERLWSRIKPSVPRRLQSSSYDFTPLYFVFFLQSTNNRVHVANLRFPKTVSSWGVVFLSRV